MAEKHKSRIGSMAYYPRKRAKKENPNFQTKGIQKGDAKAICFPGFKVGMAHILGTNMHKQATTFKQKVTLPVTIVEVPTVKVLGYRGYKKNRKTLEIVKEEKIVEKRQKKKTDKKETKEKEVKKEKKIEDTSNFDEIRLIIKTQPKLAGLAKKKGKEMELLLNGDVDKQLEFAIANKGKEISISDVFKTKDYVDVKAVTKGKGIQGVVKRFGIKMLRPHDKQRRVVGSIGPWNPSIVMFTVARPGQTGYHTRTEFNKKILKIGKAQEITKGFSRYGKLKSEYILLKGSIQGPSCREVMLRTGIRNKPAERETLDEVEKIVL